MRIRKLSLALGTAAIGVAALGAIPALGADHRDAPLATGAPQSDINDVYLFKGASGGAVMVMTVNPLTSPADTSKLRLDPSTVYNFKVDTNGDAVPDAAYKVQATGSGAVQDVTIRLASDSSAVTNDPSGTVIGSGKTSTGSGVTTINITGGKAYVGPRDDPFFFDLAGFRNGLKFTGVDTFKGTNITAIVIELNSAPATKFGIWATTGRANTLGGYDQVDRMGRPAIATVFIPSAMKDVFNADSPDRDKAKYTDEVTASLNSLNSPATETLAGLLLPDILTVDMGQAVKYLNGRGLADDVIDISLQAITGSSTIGDGVNANDNAFSASFPYLAAPNTGGAPGAPNTGTGLAAEDGGDSLGWTLPAGLIAGAALLALAGYAQRRRSVAEQA